MKESLGLKIKEYEEIGWDGNWSEGKAKELLEKSQQYMDEIIKLRFSR